VSRRTQTRLLESARRLDSRRWVITCLWLAFFLINLGLVVYADNVFYAGNAQSLSPNELGDHFRQPIKKLYGDVLATYAFYLTTMLASGFTKKSASGADARLTRFWIVLLISGFWNLLVFWRIFQMTFGHSLDIEALSEWLDSWTKESAWLITPGLVYYFGSEQR
jgi:hypothetical protein